jgi:cytochrome d ubiquinol oxidase subunit II
MHLYEIPLIFALVGLVLYTVLGGADFGAGIWQLTAGRGELSERIRDHAHDSMAPVWEANHVWLVFVLVVFWTAYPTAFGSIASTLSVPLFLAGIGIVMRGAAYALRSGIRTPRELRTIDTVFAVSSLLVPFALGATIGGIASLRVPVGNAAGNLFTSWFNATGIMIGLIAVASAAYLSAVFLAADAVRAGDEELEQAFRLRALIAGILAGGLAVVGVIVLHSDAHRLFDGLVHGGGLVALIVSVLAGVAALQLVLLRRYEPGRYVAAVAVAAIVAGWAIAQEPYLLKNLTIRQAAAPHDTLVVVIVAVIAGVAILAPSLVLLFRLVLGGRFDPGVPAGGSAVGAGAAGAGAAGAGAVAAGAGPAGAGAAGPASREIVAASRSGLVARGAGAAFLVGFATLTLADAGWAHVIGVLAFFSFIGLGFVAVAPAALAERS